MHMYKVTHTLLDIDKCNVGTHDCSQTCTNNQGSLTCECNNGYLQDEATCSGM